MHTLKSNLLGENVNQTKFDFAWELPTIKILLVFLKCESNVEAFA